MTRCLASEMTKRGIDVVPVKWSGHEMVPVTQQEANHLAKWGRSSLDPPVQS